MIASIGLLSPTAHIWISTYRIQERVKCLEFLTPTLLHSSYSLVSGRPTAVQSRVNLHSVHLSTCLYSCDGVMQHYNNNYCDICENQGFTFMYFHHYRG